MKKIFLIMMLSPLFFLFGSIDTFANNIPIENVDSSNGGVNVSPLGAKEIENKSIEYSYEVSLNAMKSTDHVQTWNSFTISLPDVAKNPIFTLVGTQQKNPDKTLTSRDVSANLGIQDQEDYFNDDSDHSIPDFETLESAGSNNFPGKIVKFKDNDNTYTGFNYSYEGINNYGVVSNISRPIGIKVSFTVSKEQSEKTPYLAVSARCSWRGFNESTSFMSASDGAGSLEDYRSTMDHSSLYYVGHPTEIKKGDFDLDGLHTASDIAITKNTSSWDKIGRDVSPGVNYVSIFNLYFNPSVYYVAPKYEDMADVAVSSYDPDYVINVHYQDEEGNKINDDVLLTGKVNDPYTAEQKEIAGYIFKKVEGNQAGVFSSDMKDVTFIYTKVPDGEGKVNVHYQDEEGNKINDDVLLTGKVNDPYTAEQKEIAGYIFKKVEGNQAGVFSSDMKDVTFIYTKVPDGEGKVNVHYQDEEGNKINDDVLLTGKVNDPYTAEQKEIAGYIFKKVEGNQAGVFSSDMKDVTFIYTKVPDGEGKVNVHYQDEEGNKINDDVLLTGKVNDPYTAEQKEIAGYIFKKVEGNQAGVFSSDMKDVTFIYTKVPDGEGKVNVHYQDEEGNKINDDVLLTGKVNDPYTAEQKEIAGYIFKKVEGNQAGVFSSDTKDVTFIYTKVPDGEEKVNKANNGQGTKGAPFSSNSTSKLYFPKTGESKGYFFVILGVVVVTFVSLIFMRRKKNK